MLAMSEWFEMKLNNYIDNSIKIKYKGINLTKEVQVFWTKNDKTLLKELVCFFSREKSKCEKF